MSRDIKYIGMDVHKEAVVIAVRNRTGQCWPWFRRSTPSPAKRVRKKKTDREDARHILELLVENRFPKIWVPSWQNRDVRQLLWHRHRMVQTRTPSTFADIACVSNEKFIYLMLFAC